MVQKNVGSMVAVFALVFFTMPIIVAAQDAPGGDGIPGLTPPWFTSGPTEVSETAASADGANVTFTFTATDSSGSSVPVSCTPPSGSLFPIGTTTVLCDAVNAIATTSTSTVVVVTEAEPAVTPSDTATLAIRDGSTLIGPVTVALPAADAAAVPLTATGDSTSHTVPARSVLALLSSLDSATSTFDITDLQYFSSFSSFIINCLSIPAAAAAPECYSWTYAVNGSFPAVGMDHTTLSNGDTAYVFFGNAWQVATDKSSVSTGESFTVTAQKYDAAGGTYVAAPNEEVGAVQFDASFNATEFATSTTDSSGHATLSLANAGSYSVGVTQTGYYPNVSVAVATPTPPVVSGGSSSGPSVSKPQFSVPNALAYLSSVQSSDGSFANQYLSDWAALAFAAADPGAAKQSLRAYMQKWTPALSSITDYERHAMALQALGIDPYIGTATNYIAPIVAAFDGTQVGGAALVNDDIFALFPLLHAGYSPNDAMIQKIAAFIVSQQSENGSWQNSTDVTSAAVQALSLVKNVSGVTAALSKAENFLRLKQQTDGGFLDAGGLKSSSTGWALQAIAALGTSGWTVNGFSGQDYLAAVQQNDGGVEAASTDAQTRVWSTGYAIPGYLGRTWDSLLASFTAPATGGGAVLGASIETAATSTALATSTPAAATTTPPTATSSVPVIAAAASTSPDVPPVLTAQTVTRSSAGIVRGAAVHRTKPASNTPATSTPTPTTTMAQAAVAASAATDAFHLPWWIWLLIVLAALAALEWMRRRRKKKFNV